MGTIEATTLPAGALLCVHAVRGGYVDCFATTVAGDVALQGYVAAFYTSGLFRIERRLLGWLARRPSTDAQARELASAARDTFAAWEVEARDPRQLLLRDFTGRTRSWLMVEPGNGMTRLLFGSAVLPTVDRRTGLLVLGRRVHALLGFHRLYSKALLRAAVRRLAATARHAEVE
jgi:hypothetical protein